QRIRIGDPEAGTERAERERRVADLEWRVLDRNASPPRLGVPGEWRPRGGSVLADGPAPQLEARCPHERDAVPARSGTPRRRIAERGAEARALRYERRVERPRRAVLHHRVGQAARDRGDVERIAARRLPQALGTV